jgi:predicted lipoprotein with Yx(FWY)xxD motif
MRRAVLALLPLMLLAGCGSAATSSDPATSTRASAATEGPTATSVATATAVAATQRPRHHAAKPPLAIRVAETNYGRALVDRRGFALYLFTHDPAGATKCAGACAAAWPPYVVGGRTQRAEPEARTTLLGTIRRPDGRLQVTYRGHPLYYYVGDRQPHQVLCQAVTEFGGTWYVVKPDGSPIRSS